VACSSPRVVEPEDVFPILPFFRSKLTKVGSGTKDYPYSFSIFAKANTASVLQLSAVGAFPEPTFVNSGFVALFGMMVIEQRYQPLR
jgi:hypothetical protein